MLLLIFRRRIRLITRGEALAGGLIGVWLSLGYILQTNGLESATTAKTGFITGLSVVIVPVLSTAVLRHVPRWGAVLGVLSATVGLGLLTLDQKLHVQSGDLWVLGGACGFAFHIITVARYSPHYDPLRLAIPQVVTAAALATGSAFVFETPTVRLPADTWGAIVFTGVVATALAFSLQTMSNSTPHPRKPS